MSHNISIYTYIYRKYPHNVILQTKLIDRNLEIADLKRQLNGRNDRRRNREDSSLPPYTEQENERGRILTINRLPDYQAVQ